jgi:hypothetical protein
MPLAEFDGDYKDFEDRYAGDKSVHARFYIRPVHNEAKSAAAGRPIFDDKEFVEIRASGNSTNIVDRPVGDLDRRRFARQYTLFKAGDNEQIVGTRLTEVPWITRSQCEELAYLKVLTVEQLANVNDQLCTTMVGVYELKRRAAAYLEQAVGSAPITALQAENANLKNELETMKEAIREQGELLKSFQAQQAPTKAT